MARLAGRRASPRAESQPVTGRFVRVCVNAPPKKGGANEPAPAKETPADDDIDPAGVPPLDIAIEELRFGDAVFGKAEVHTRPVPGGRLIERLQTRAPGQRMDDGGQRPDLKSQSLTPHH